MLNSKIRFRLWIFHVHHIFKRFYHTRFHSFFSCRFINIISNNPYLIKTHNLRIHPLSSDLRLYDCNYFLCGFNWGVNGGILIHRTSFLLINFLNSWLQWSDELSNIKHVFLFQLFKCIFESFTSFMNNQNDLEKLNLLKPIALPLSGLRLLR